MQSSSTRSGCITSPFQARRFARRSRSSRPQVYRFSVPPTESDTIAYGETPGKKVLTSLFQDPDGIIVQFDSACLTARATSWLRLFGCEVHGGHGLQLLCFALNRALKGDCSRKARSRSSGQCRPAPRRGRALFALPLGSFLYSKPALLKQASLNCRDPRLGLL
jgi:hypothetical protein